MKSKPLVLILLGMLSLYGCSLPEPLDLGTKCSDETHGLSEVVYRRITCHSEDVTGENRDVCRDELIHCYPEDVTGEKKDVCGRFADAFEHGYCPMESPFCYDRVSDEFKCIFEHCGIEDGHEYEGKCEEDTTSHCGKHGKGCELGPNWLASQCKIDEGTGLAECVATDCMTGYALNAGECVKIVLSDLDNCGSYNTKCSNIVVGWQDGTCDQGMCIPSECQTGYHLNEGSCVADDSNNCGSVGNVCGQGQVCTKGECSDNCGDGEVRCEKGGAVSCVDPNTSTAYCGADDSCSSYTTCKDGQACVGGECKQNSCTNEDETLCVVQGENVCIALDSDNADHCGMCNQKCSDRIMPNALSNTCSGGQCQYTCKEGYENCGIATVPNCINTAHFQNDPNNCGECGKTCNAGEFCNAGTCQKSPCTNQCLVNDKCVNKNDACGTQCIDCNSENNAASGTCKAGTCEITSCIAGYHLTTDKTCERNTPTACGSTNKADAVNCRDTATTHATDAYCNTNGQCVATSCEKGYHVEEGACVQDSNRACGASAVDCTKLPGWNTGTCENGQCKATSCQTGFCLNSTTCVDGRNSTLTCGISGGACISCHTESQACTNGQCVITSCAENVCFYQGLTCSNTAEHCGKDCVNCNTANHASAGTCNVSTGTCTITNCKSGFHKSKSGTSCVANTATSCAPPNSSVTENCMTDGHATDGDCNENGQCVAKSCETGYTLSDGKCVESGGSGCKDHYITMNLEGRDVTAYCIETVEDLRAVYHGERDEKAYALMQDFSLEDLDVGDTWKPFFADGFSGIFFGNRKTLSGNLSCSSDCAVFGELRKAQILDLNLDVRITGYGKARIGAVSVLANNAVLKNITSSGLLRSENGTVGGLLVHATNRTIVNDCHVTSDIDVRSGGAGGLIYDSQASTIVKSSYEGTLETHYGDATGGLVGILAKGSVIEASYVGEKSVIQSKTESPTGGLVGSILGDSNRILMSYFAGSVTSRGRLGGLVGMMGGGLKIEKSVVFGNIVGLDSVFDAVGGLIGSIETEGEVIIQSSASVGDIDAKSKTVAGIAHMMSGILTIHDLYHLGKINGLRTSYDDFVHSGGEIRSKHYLSWVKLQQYIEHDSISTAGNELLAKKSGEKLVTDLNQYTESNFGEESWTTSMCTITSGPAEGTSTKYNLPLPKKLPKPSFCE